MIAEKGLFDMPNHESILAIGRIMERMRAKGMSHRKVMYRMGQMCAHWVELERQSRGFENMPKYVWRGTLGLVRR